jgi:ACT domain-containing protein
MGRYVLRIWLPDRPGALGLVASRIGAVGGDIVAIDILDRADGRAADEFVVELERDDLVELLRTEIHEVDGARVEDVRRVEDRSASPDD